MNDTDLDAIMQSLKTLPPVDVPASRVADIRRCAHERLTRTQRRPPGLVRRPWRSLAEPGLVAGVSAVFLVEVIRRALTVWRP